MQHHEGYKLCCEKRGTGTYARLYKNFGNIHESSFDDWWRENGAQVFAEPQTMFRTQLVSPRDVRELVKLKEQPLLVLIPKDAPKTLILKRVREILKEFHPNKPGKKTSAESNALYKVHQHFVIVSLWKMLTAYELRKNYPQVPLWDIGMRLNRAASDWENDIKIDWKERMAIPIAKPDAAEMATLTSATSRMKKKAQKAIENTGKGKFPKFD